MIVSWSEAIDSIIAGNMEARAKNPGGGGSPRGRGGRSPRGRGKRPG